MQSPRNPYLVNAARSNSPRSNSPRNHQLAGDQMASLLSSPFGQQASGSEYQRQYQWHVPQSNLLLNIRVNQGNQGAPEPSEQIRPAGRPTDEFTPPSRNAVGPQFQFQSSPKPASPRNTKQNERQLSASQPFASWDTPSRMRPRREPTPEVTAASVEVARAQEARLRRRDATPEREVPASPTRAESGTQTPNVPNLNLETLGTDEQWHGKRKPSTSLLAAKPKDKTDLLWHDLRLDLPNEYFQDGDPRRNTAPASSIPIRVHPAREGSHRGSRRGRMQTPPGSNHGSPPQSPRSNVSSGSRPQSRPGSRPASPRVWKQPKHWDRDPMDGTIPELLDEGERAEFRRKPWRLRDRKWPGTEGVDRMLHELAASGSTNGVRVEAAIALWGDNEEMWDEDAKRRIGELDRSLDKAADFNSTGLDAVRALRQLDRESFDLCRVLGVRGADVIPDNTGPPKRRPRKP